MLFPRMTENRDYTPMIELPQKYRVISAQALERVAGIEKLY